MPIKIPNDLPARKILEEEGIFVMPEDRAIHQDIRPMQVVLLNLMPTKVETETQIARLLGNTPLQVELTLLQTATYTPRNVSAQHLLSFYKTFDDIRERKFDGLIVTGAPVELLDWTQVEYWQELTAIFDWSVTHVHASLFICWGAQAALQHFHKVPKHPLPRKMFGIFPHRVAKRNTNLLRGFDQVFHVPVSRHTEVRREDILTVGTLDILAESEEAGVYIVESNIRRQVFVFNHAEYDAETLAREYWRDRSKGLDIHVPKNYFPGDNPDLPPIVTWRSHACLLFSNWLNYRVYQDTPFDLGRIG